MDTDSHLDAALRLSLGELTCHPCPPQLSRALVSAVLPGGGRVRPSLVLAVTRALSPDDAEAWELSLAGAVAVEFLHCGSLVHDDLPCFDDAPVRRGRPSVQASFGENLAVLTGDALIVAAFQVLARQVTIPRRGALAGRMLTALGQAAGVPCGIAAGQAWESEPVIDLKEYHDSKTAALFEASVSLGALAAGAEPAPWRAVGWRLGEAYQLADDLADASDRVGRLGKPVGQDARHGRPNAAHELGLAGATARLRGALAGACEAVPACGARADLQEKIRAIGGRLLRLADSNASPTSPNRPTHAALEPAS